MTNDQYNKNNERRSLTDTARGVSALTYLMVGGGIGAILALLFAPKSGAEFRGDITDVAKRGYDQTADLANRASAKSSELYQTAKEKANGVLDLATSKSAEVQTKIGDAVDKAGENAAGAAHQIENKFGATGAR